MFFRLPVFQVFSGLRSLGVVETHIGPATQSTADLPSCWKSWNMLKLLKPWTIQRQKMTDTSQSGPSSQAMLKLSYKSLVKIWIQKMFNWLGHTFCAFPGFQLALPSARSKPNGSQSKAIWMDKCSIFPSVDAWNLKAKARKNLLLDNTEIKAQMREKWKLRRLRLRSSQRPVRCEPRMYSRNVCLKNKALSHDFYPHLFSLYISFSGVLANPPGTRKSRGKMATSHLLWLSFNPVFFGVHGRALLWRTEFAPNHGQRGTSTCFVSCRFWCSIYVRVCEWCLFASCRDCCRLYFLSSAAWNHLILGLEAFTCLMWQTFNRCFPKPWSKMS